MINSFGDGFDKVVMDWKEECEKCDTQYFFRRKCGKYTRYTSSGCLILLFIKKDVRDMSQLDELGVGSDTEEEGSDHDGTDLDLGATDVDAVSTTSSMASESATSSPCSSESEDMASDFELSDSDPEANEGDDEQPLTTELAKQCILGYKFEFDNFDKTVKPRHMTTDSRTKSMHYVHIYSVKDRIDFSSLQNTPLQE